MKIQSTLAAIATLLCSLGVASCTRAQSPPKPPDLTLADSWLNTNGDKPLSMADLKGQVVLLDFWTYCCINCIHVFPDLDYLQQKYTDQPFVIIGVHSGKFSQEKDAENIRQAVLRFNITHPVAVDSRYKIWNAYGVSAWPTQILLGPDGNIAGEWSGESHRDEIDARIDSLLKAGKAAGTLAAPIHFATERATFKSGILEFPGKILADAAGNRLFIADTNHNRILVTDLNGNVSRIIGDGATGLKDGDFAHAEFRQPQGLALSNDGKTLYIADTENHCIRAADLDHATVTTLAGTGSQAEFEPNNTPGKTTALSSPWDLARVGTTLYIAMAGVHQIWALDLKSDLVTVYAGNGGEGDVDGPNTTAGFAQPSGISTDGTHLFIADSEASSIRSVTLDGSTTATVAGSGQLFGYGQTDGPGKSARFQHPLGVVPYNGSLFVADTFNGLIRRIDLKTTTVTTWLGSTAGDATAYNFYEPGGLSIAGDTLFVADTNHHRIIAIDIPTKKARILAIQLAPR
jgi:DNA-binding beta-propeller fold protein YncE